jgi:hypothetical protein
MLGVCPCRDMEFIFYGFICGHLAPFLGFVHASYLKQFLHTFIYPTSHNYFRELLSYHFSDSILRGTGWPTDLEISDH